MTDITISVYHIIYLTQSIDNTFGSLEKLASTKVFTDDANTELRQIIMANAYSQILILTNSLNDEYSKYFIVKNAKTEVERAKVEQIRKVLKPVFNKIDEWKDVRDFRNNVLTHNLRVGHESVFLINGLGGYNIPEKINDYALLIRCVHLIKQVVYKIFENEYLETDAEIRLRSKSKKTTTSSRDYEKEYEDLKKEIWEIKKRIEAEFN